MISLHVNDFTISSDLQTTLDGIGKALAGKFEMTDDGELSQVTGYHLILLHHDRICVCVSYYGGSSLAP